MTTSTSPLASGRLTRDKSETYRSLETNPIAKQIYDTTALSDKMVIERVAEVAERHGIPCAHIALAWMLQKVPVIAPAIGATKIQHLESAVEAISVKLFLEEMAYLEEPYIPHSLVGLIPYGGQLFSVRK